MKKNLPALCTSRYGSIFPLNNMKRVIYLLFSLFLLQTATAQLSVSNLHCEMLVNPLGIETKQPRLSWQLNSLTRNVVQTSYQVIVSSSAANLKQNKGDIWNSGKVFTNKSLHIAYAGPALKPATHYFWKVLVGTNKGQAQTTQSAYFSTGLNSSDWKAKWIGYDKGSAWDSITQWSRLSARYLRKEFESKPEIKRAMVYLSGLGMYELYINGKKIGDQVLAPNPTDYRKSFFYNTHEVTKQVKAGKNSIATVLGNGRFFTMRQNYKTHKHNNFGFPKLLLQLEIEYTDGRKEVIVSDESWKLNVDGPIRTNNEYDGEEYDARKEWKGWTMPGFNDQSWIQPEMVSAPPGVLTAQMSEPMKVMKLIMPKSIRKLPSGNYILDMGQNFSGWIALKNIVGNAGDKAVLRFAESLKPDGELYVANLRDAKVTDVYTLKGKGLESWEPSFVYHGFRYVEISAFPGKPLISQFEGKLVYDALETTGSFETSNKTINKVYQNAWWGIASNYKGMPVDCPQRNERQPWLGDRTVGAQGESYVFGNGNLYAKWMKDIEESQTAEGSIPDVAPAFWNYYSDDVTWPAAFFFISNNLYNQFGNLQPIQQHYPAMKKWMGYMKEKFMKAYIMTRDKYGDWCVPPEALELIHAKDPARLTDGQLIATAYYYKLLSYMQRFAGLTGNNADSKYYGELSDSIRTAFQAKFYDSQKKQYGNNTITSNLLPLYFGICPDSLKATIFEKIRYKIHVESHDHVSTGVIGSSWLMRGLTEYGYADLAYILASNKTYPSYGYMAENGATTIWELWNGNTADPGMNSQNHVMLLGDLITWYYENLAGIRTDKKEVAFKKIIMKPTVPAGLDYVKASYRSQYGLIISHWINSTAVFDWTVRIPANTSAVLYIPAASMEELSEGFKPVSANKEIKFVKAEDGVVVLEVPSGNYRFNRNKKWKKGIVNDEFIFERASFPESHAATIAETSDGLIAAWFGGTKEGNKDVCIWTSHYKNNQWTAPMMVADGVMNDTLRYPCYNPVLFYTPNKELLLFYKIGPNVAGWTGWMKRSKDNGKTWNEREALPEGFLGPIKNKPVLVNGVLICPSSTEKTGWKFHLEYTKDWGRTWTKSAALNDPKIFTAIQPSLLQYKDGRMQLLGRSQNRTVNEVWSTDGGKTWSPMRASSLPNNNSGTDAVTLKDGRQLIVYNHVKPDSSLPRGKGARTPLNVAISNDGKTWQAVLVLEDSPVSQYSYPSVIQTSDGLVHIVYTWRREKVKHVVMDPSKLEGKKIVNEQWPGGLNKVSKPSED